jgi:hypothetical protein
MRWAGTSWTSEYIGAVYEVRALRSFDDGSGPALYAGGGSIYNFGYPTFARFRGPGTWPEYPPDQPQYVVTSLSQPHDDGHGEAMFIGGYFTNITHAVPGTPHTPTTRMAKVVRCGSPRPACVADCNADGALTVADFGCFQTKFVLADPYADCNQDGLHTVADFECFQMKFVVGCP